MAASTLLLAFGASVCLCVAVNSAPDKGFPGERTNLKSFYENLSSSHSQSTSTNKTHMVTVYTTSKDSDTNGTLVHQKETTYVINNNGNITMYTIREPDSPPKPPPRH